MAHARQPLSPCLRERGQIIFQSVTPFPLFFFLFSFFLSSPLLFPSLLPFVPDHRTTGTRYRGSFARRVEREGMGWIVAVAGFWELVYFFFSLFLLLFSFFRSLFLYGARITQGKLNFCNVRTGREGFVIDRSNDRSIRFFASCFLYIYIYIYIYSCSYILKIEKLNMKGSGKKNIRIDNRFS